MRGGRGSGKTRTGAEAFAEWLLRYEPSRWAIVAPTFAEARDKCIEGESGLLAALLTSVNEIKAGTSPTVLTYNRSIGELTLVNGASVIIDGADDGAPSIQGENLAGVWADEVGLWKKWATAWEESIGFAVRKAPALIVATGTPKGNAGIVRLLREDPETVETLLRLTDNEPNLSASRIAQLRRRYGGTRLGRQELEGEVLEDVEGALWRLMLIEELRVPDPPIYPQRIVVAIDPAGSSAESADETGIVAAALRGEPEMGESSPHAFVLADESGHYSPTGWASAAIGLYRKLGADRIVAERNFGGEMVESTLRAVDPSVPVTTIHASRGKAIRAEPVSALYEQQRVHHVGAFPDLESEMTTWVPGDPDSPNRLDALVWAITELMLGGGEARVGSGLRDELHDPTPAPSLTADLLDREM